MRSNQQAAATTRRAQVGNGFGDEGRRRGRRRPFLGVAAAVAAAALAVALLVVGGPGTATGPVHRAEVMPLTSMNQSVGVANNSPLLLADPGEARFVVQANRLDAPDFSCALQVSGDGGKSWAPANPVRQLPPGAEKCYAPEVAFDAKGTLYYLFVGLHGVGNEPMGAFLTSSADRARTFTPPHQVLEGNNFGVRMAIDGSLGDRGRLHLVWLHATSDPPLGGFAPPPNPIMSAYSDDGGKTFSEPVQVSDPGRQRVVAPALVLGGDHAVHVAYYDLGADVIDYQGLEGPTWDGTWSLVVTTSTDRGRRFGPGRVVDDGIVPTERVMLIFTMPPASLAARGDELCAAWTDGRYGDADVLLRCSAERGQRWGPVRRVNDDRRGDGARQYLPRIAIAPGGRLDAVFYDRRSDPQGIGTDLFYTWSDDDGEHFARNYRVTKSSFDSRIGQQYINVSAEGQVEFGSRLGLLSRAHDAVVAWPDTRHSRDGTTGQDLFSTTLELSRSGGPGWARPVGGVLLAAVVAASAAALLRRRRRPTPAGTPEPVS